MGTIEQPRFECRDEPQLRHVRRDRGWWRHKLMYCTTASRGRCFGADAAELRRRCPGIVAAMATLICYRCEQLGAFRDIRNRCDALVARHEPQTALKALPWTVDDNHPPAEFIPTEGVADPHDRSLQRRFTPSGCRITQRLDGLCKACLDMLVIDHAASEEVARTAELRRSKGDFAARARPGRSRSIRGRPTSPR
jgi:hypothetical protein